MNVDSEECAAFNRIWPNGNLCCTTDRHSRADIDGINPKRKEACSTEEQSNSISVTFSVLELRRASLAMITLSKDGSEY
jgi:hypothetical protein